MTAPFVRLKSVLQSILVLMRAIKRISHQRPKKIEIHNQIEVEKCIEMLEARKTDYSLRNRDR